MLRIALLLVVCVAARMASAEEATPRDSAMYLIGIKLKEVVTTTGDSEKTRIIAEPKVVTVEDREAVFHVGMQTKAADETVRAGTLLKVKVKKLDGNKVRISGVFEVSTLAHPSDDFVERTATEYHFSSTVSLDEKVCLVNRQMAEVVRIVELTCHCVDALELTDSSSR